MEQQDIERLDELAVLDVEIAAIGSDLAIHNLIFRLAMQRWPKLWRIATAIKPQAALRNVYEILIFDENFFTLTARMPTASGTGVMYRLLRVRERDSLRETLQAMVEQIKREISEGNCDGLKLWGDSVYQCPNCGDFLH